MTRDERNIAICAAYEAGASLRQVAERFGVTPEGVRQVMLRCGHPLRSRSEGRRARLHADPEFARRNSEAARERMKALNADREFARRHSEAARERMKALHADPEFARRNSEAARERMKALNADPEFARRRSERASERMKALHADPEFARRNSERMKALNADPLRNPLVTLTPAQRAVYDLLRRKGCRRDDALAEARRPIRGEAAE